MESKAEIFCGWDVYEQKKWSTWDDMVCLWNIWAYGIMGWWKSQEYVVRIQWMQTKIAEFKWCTRDGPVGGSVWDSWLNTNIHGTRFFSSDPNLRGLFVTFSGVKWFKWPPIWVIKRSRMEEAGMQIRNVTKCYTFTNRRLLFVTLWRVFHWETGCWFYNVFLLYRGFWHDVMIGEKKRTIFHIPQKIMENLRAPAAHLSNTTPPKNSRYYAGWWQLKYVLFSSRTLGKWSKLTFAYFWDGLKPPTSYELISGQ